MSHVRKSKLVDVRLEQYAGYLAADPSAARGSWRDLLPGEGGRLHVDLGCGKGLWLSRAAAALPGDVFVGVDNDKTCVSFAVERVGVACLENARVVFDSAHNIADLFAPGEIDVLHVNFPTPFPRKKEAAKRVTAAEQLMRYRELLAPGGLLQLKTDSQPLFDFTLDQLADAGYDVLELTRDLHGAGCDAAFSLEDRLLSQYEEKLTAKGARVLALHAVPGAYPVAFAPAEPVGLIEYLPDDLESLAYAPHGMEDAVANLINRRRNAEAKARRAAKG